MKLSIVIPVYNEENRIEKTADTLDKYIKNSFIDYEVIFVNDGSTDKTDSILQKLSKQYLNFKVTGYNENHGKGRAVRTGILSATGDIIVYTDCDLPYGTEVIESAIKLLDESKADIVIGSRNLKRESYDNYSFARKLMSKVYFKLISAMSGFTHSDSQCGFKVLKRNAAHDIFAKSKIDSFAFDLEVLMMAEKKGYTIVELPVVILNHNRSSSKVSPFRDALKMLRDVRKIKKELK